MQRGKASTPPEPDLTRERDQIDGALFGLHGENAGKLEVSVTRGIGDGLAGAQILLLRASRIVAEIRLHTAVPPPSDSDLSMKHAVA